MREFHVHTFSGLPLKECQPQATALIMEGAFDHTTKNLNEAMVAFQAEAKIVVEALTTSLPQGTLDQVLLLLLAGRASHYVGKPGT